MTLVYLRKAFAAAFVCVFSAGLASYLHYTMKPWDFVVPIMVFVPPVAMALLLWRQLASRLVAILILEGLSFFSAMWIAVMVFHDAP